MNKKRFLQAALAIIALLFSPALDAQEGKFYASFSDYENSAAIPGYVIKPQEHSCSPRGDKYLVGPDVAHAKWLKAVEFPAELFTYDNYYGFYLFRAVKGKTYIVLSHGKYCFYAWHFAQGSWYYSETITGEMKEFDEKILKETLAEFGLLEDYIKEDPKKAPREDDDTFFNRQTAHVIKYYNLLNKKIEE